ncbi:MAG: protein phosphatase 2C domain-containing protein [Rhodothermales bacterium]
MLNTTVRAGAATDTGRQRESNEDTFLCVPDQGIFAVIDGVGGYAGGEVAAAEAREVIHRRLANRTDSPAMRLREAVANANNRIYWRSQEDLALSGMACVLTVALLENDHLFAAHVGDTRLYKIRNHQIEKLTRDHSFVGLREDSGALSEYEAMHHPRRNEILRDVGSELHEPDDEYFIDILETIFEPNCALLLCTDGLTDLVPSRNLLQLIYENAGDPQAAVEALIRAANEAGGTDNITVIVVEGPGFERAHKTPFEATNKKKPSPYDVDTGIYPSRPQAPPLQASHPTPEADLPASDDGRPHTPDASPPPSPWRYFTYGIAAALALLAATYLVWTFWPSPPPSRTDTPSPTPEETPPAIPPDGALVSIQQRLDRARPGDTVLIPPGLYRETIQLRDSVTLQSAEPGTARLVPPDSSGPGLLAAIEAEGVAGAAVIGFAIGPDTTSQETAQDSFAVGILARNAAIRIDNVTITGTLRAGVDLEAGATASQVVLENSEIARNAGIGVIVRGLHERIRITGNEIYANGDAGIVLVPSLLLDLQGNRIEDHGTTDIEIRLDSVLYRMRRLNTLPETNDREEGVRVLLGENNRP